MKIEGNTFERANGLTRIAGNLADGTQYAWNGAGAVYDDRDEPLYRYQLWRTWTPEKPIALFLMLNPSTATHLVLDPTLRRCKAYARQWGFGGFEVLNLFAWRATNPKDMKAAPDPIGPHNDNVIRARTREVFTSGGVIVAGWGEHGKFKQRGHHVRVALIEFGIHLHYLKLTQKGEPTHPLYLSKTLWPTRWV